ncbi:MAG: hypothetical protein HYT09_03635 [Candidatus Levybacteria bacterium]|nr:hypothetical protein [Candidatus Levybacteria bacterium]
MNIPDIGQHLTDEELKGKNLLPEEEEEILRHLERCVQCTIRKDALVEDDPLKRAYWGE